MRRTPQKALLRYFLAGDAARRLERLGSNSAYNANAAGGVERGGGRQVRL